MKETDLVMHAAARWQQRCVLATVVETRGSSYRRTGAMMLVGEDGSLVGAVSGGCIEKEIVRRSEAVFANGQAIVIEYDGRYTLGCNGTILILIEPFEPEARKALFSRYFEAFRDRTSWKMVSRYASGTTGSVLVFGDAQVFPLRAELANMDEGAADEKGWLSTTVHPSRQLFIFGSEMDAAKLATLAAELGYLPTVFGHPRNPDIQIGAQGIRVEVVAPESVADRVIADANTAVVLMTHSYSRDLAYLSQLLALPMLPYLGCVGPKQRTDELLSVLVEQGQEMPDWLDQSLHAPAGLDIGGEMPAEVSMAILAEIQMAFSGYQGGHLTDKAGPIHHERV